MTAPSVLRLGRRQHPVTVGRVLKLLARWVRNDAPRGHRYGSGADLHIWLDDANCDARSVASCAQWCTEPSRRQRPRDPLGALIATIACGMSQTQRIQISRVWRKSVGRQLGWT